MHFPFLWSPKAHNFRLATASLQPSEIRIRCIQLNLRIIKYACRAEAIFYSRNQFFWFFLQVYDATRLPPSCIQERWDTQKPIFHSSPTNARALVSSQILSRQVWAARSDRKVADDVWWVLIPFVSCWCSDVTHARSHSFHLKTSPALTFAPLKRCNRTIKLQKINSCWNRRDTTKGAKANFSRNIIGLEIKLNRTQSVWVEEIFFEYCVGRTKQNEKKSMKIRFSRFLASSFERRTKRKKLVFSASDTTIT